MFRPIQPILAAISKVWDAGSQNNRRSLRSPNTVFVYYKDFADPFGISQKKQARTSTSVESELTWGSGHFFGGSHDMGDPEMGKWDGLGFLKKLQKEIYGPGWSLILIPAMPVEFEDY